LRILWLNWRDIKNPDAGGAEVFTHEIMRRLISKNYRIDLFTSRFPNSHSIEDIDGVRILREGGKYGVYRKAKQYYNSHRERYDLVIDEINTRPFLTPKFVKEKPILAIFHQMAREFWFYETRFPLNYLGYYYLERKWLSYYRNIPTVTISNSSRQDLVKMGFKNIFMVPEGLSVKPLPKPNKKEPTPTLVFIGRLKKAKLPHHALQAFSVIKKEMEDAQMWIIGEGYMRKELENSNIRDVIFYGHIKDELKYELLSRAHMILVPGVREGWGLIVTEANAMGTPAIGYNVPGLRDSIRDGETGIIVKENSPYDLATSAKFLLKNQDMLDKFSINALNYAKQFSWDNTINAFEKIISII
jgi:glycosyltransferase involved in cell wall biosynthesis